MLLAGVLGTFQEACVSGCVRYPVHRTLIDKNGALSVVAGEVHVLVPHTASNIREVKVPVLLQTCVEPRRTTFNFHGYSENSSISHLLLPSALYITSVHF